MTRRELLFSGVGALASAAERRPNVVLIVADDLGYGELGCQGFARDIPTPHIDSLARDGVRFTQAYATAPYCAPSRAALLTGRVQTRFGFEFNPIGKDNHREECCLPRDEKLLPEYFREAGYATGLIGKWHLGSLPEYRPHRRGFDEFFGFLDEGHFYRPKPYDGLQSWLRKNEPPYDEDNPVRRGDSPVEEREYLTRAFAREAVSFVERHRERPFFLYLPFNAIHQPMQAETRDLEKFSSIDAEPRRILAAMLSSLDEAVGAVLGKLKERGLEKNTVVMFVSDNGGPADADMPSGNGPLRGRKGQLFEGGIRVPLLIRWPGVAPAGGVYDRPVSTVDLFATGLAAAGVKTNGIDGVDLLPFLRGSRKGSPHDELFWRHGPNIAFRSGDWKLVRQRTGAGDAPYMLFDLRRDPGESKDLAASEPERMTRMRAGMMRWHGSMKAARWVPPYMQRMLEKHVW